MKFVINNREVLIDNENEHLSNLNWYLNKDGYLAITRDKSPFFLHWMVIGKPSKGFVVDHINRNIYDNTKNNLRFVSYKDNCRNRSNNRIVTIFGETKCVSAWIEDARCKIDIGTFYNRLGLNWDFEKIITTPIDKISRYSREEDLYIIENFRKIKTNEIANHLGRSVGSLYDRIVCLKSKGLITDDHQKLS